MTRYTALWGGVLFLLGCLIEPELPRGVPLAWLGAAVVALLVFSALLLTRGAWQVARRGALALAILGIGLLWTAHRAPASGPACLQAAVLHEVSGTVTGYPELGLDSVRFVLQPDHLKFRVQVTVWHAVDEPVTVHYGDRLRVIGSSRAPEPFAGFDYPAYLARRGILSLMSAQPSGVERIGQGGWWVFRTGDRVRQWILGRLRRVLGDRRFGLAQSLLFGDRRALDPEIEETFSRSGLMHLLAVSGLHLGILLAGVWGGLRLAGVRPAIAYPIALVAALLILWIVGPRTTLVRATVMAAFIGVGSVLADLGWILRRTVRPLNGLAVAAVVLVAIQPGRLQDAGFQLSFAATAAILVALTPSFGLLDWIEQRAARAGRLRRLVVAGLGLLAISAAAQAGASPVVAVHFGGLHPVALAANLVLIPLAAIGLWSGALGVVGLALGVPIAVRPFAWILTGLEMVTRWVAWIPVAEMPVAPWVGLWLGGLVLFVYGCAYVRSSSFTSNSTSIASEPLGGAEGCSVGCDDGASQ